MASQSAISRRVSSHVFPQLSLSSTLCDSLDLTVCPLVELVLEYKFTTRWTSVVSAIDGGSIAIRYTAYPDVIINGQPISITIRVTSGNKFDVRMNESEDLTGGNRKSNAAELRRITHLRGTGFSNMVVMHMSDTRPGMSTADLTTEPQIMSAVL